MDNWYNKASEYWSQIPATVDGVLGGYESISDLDLKSSLEFLSQFYSLSTAISNQKEKENPSVSCDCGAGIGRVTKGLLVHLFDKVDLVESNPKFIQEAKSNYLADISHKIGLYIQVGLEDFNPLPSRYNLIWCQWVLGHLKESDLIQFLKRCKNRLIKGGMIGIKENISKSGIEVDSIDSSVTRSDSILKEIFSKAGLEIVKEQDQVGFPRELYLMKDGRSRCRGGGNVSHDSIVK